MMSQKPSPVIVDLTDDDPPSPVQSTSQIVVTPHSNVYKKVSLINSSQSGQPSVTRIGLSGVVQPSTRPMLHKVGILRKTFPQKTLPQTSNQSGLSVRPPPLQKIGIMGQSSTQKMGTTGQTSTQIRPLLKRVTIKGKPVGSNPVLPLKLTPITTDSQLMELISKNKLVDNQVVKIVQVIDGKGKVERVRMVNQLKSASEEVIPIIDLDSEIKPNRISKIQPKVEQISPKYTLKDAKTGEKYEIVKPKSTSQLLNIKIEDTDKSNKDSENSPFVIETVVKSANFDRAHKNPLKDATPSVQCEIVKPKTSKLVSIKIEDEDKSHKNSANSPSVLETVVISSNSDQALNNATSTEKDSENIIFVIGQDEDSSNELDDSTNNTISVIGENTAKLINYKDKTNIDPQVLTSKFSLGQKFTVDRTLQTTMPKRNPYIDLVNRTLGITESRQLAKAGAKVSSAKQDSIHPDVQESSILNKYLYMENKLGMISKENEPEMPSMFDQHGMYPTDWTGEENIGPCTDPYCISVLDPKNSTVGEPILENPDLIYLKRLVNIPKPTKKDLDSIELGDIKQEEAIMLNNLEKWGDSGFLRTTSDDGKQIYIRKNTVLADVLKAKYKFPVEIKKLYHPKFVSNRHLSCDVTAPDAFRLLRTYMEKNIKFIKEKEIEVEKLTEKKQSLDDKIEKLERTKNVLINKREILENRKRKEIPESETPSAKYPKEDSTDHAINNNGILQYSEENSMDNDENMDTENEDLYTENEDLYTENHIENITEQLTEQHCTVVAQEEVVPSESLIGMPILDDLTVTSNDSKEFEGFDVPLDTTEYQNVADDNVDMNLVLESQQAIVALAKEFKTMQ